MKKVFAFLVTFVLLVEVPLWAGLGSDKAMFVGGTVSTVSEKTEGKLSLDSTRLLFLYKKAQLEIPYDRINNLEYGQKAGRRLGLGIAVSPLFLFSKKRKHFLTVGYLNDKNQQEAAVFELGKSVIRPTLSGLEQKTGKKVDYEDDEARKGAGAK